MSVGGMIASSILFGRALAPFDQAIEVWKHVTGARESYNRLQDAFLRQSSRHESMSMPKPEGTLSVENIFFAPPATTPNAQSKYTVRQVTFALEPGDILAIIGPSAAGKSTIAKLLVGIWKPLSGVVRLDSADVYTWNRNDFGQHVGYLPQGIELFNGNIKDNIARMQKDADPQEIIKAAKLAGAHEMILNLANGYETDIGIGGASISAGQRQRVGLARAYFGDPKLVVLDEPNANLDEIGEHALLQALLQAKERKITSIIISHRPAILSSVDKILVLHDGAVAAFGPRNEILARFAAQANAAGNVPTPEK
jgi:ATP-binding cassette subfamily C protein